MNSPIFISAGIGQWYSTGVQRLGGSLIDKGWPGNMQLWVDEWPASEFPREPIYAIKAAAFEWAIKNGCETIVWGDASVTMKRAPTKFLDEIARNGRWLGRSGYNCAQVCGDKMLDYFGVTRDWAETVPDCATGLFGVNISFPESRAFIEQWIKAAKDGAFQGSRFHAGQSADPRFIFGRQDQACASLIAGKLGWELDHMSDHVTFAWDKDNGQEFHCQGM